MRTAMLLTTLLALSLPFTGSAMAQERGFDATYRAYYGSMRGAETVFSLAREDETEWLWSSRSEPAGMVAMFRDDVITERSRFRVEESDIRALEYRYRHVESDETRRYRELRFDRESEQVHYDDNGKEGELPLQAGSLDRFLAQYALMRALSNDQRPDRFRIVDGDEQFDQTMEYGEQQTIRVRAGRFETQRVTMDDADSDRSLVLWMAPRLGYLPVKLEQREPGETTVTMELESTNRARQ